MKIHSFLAKALLMLFAAFFCFTGARANEVEIGDGGETFNIYLPSFNYYNYSLSQQIYTAAEIGTDGTIHSIAFKNIGAEKTRTYSVYMLHTDKETFESGNDWVSMSNADLVFSGDVTFAVDSWTEINLEAPFDYDGISNLIIGVADNTGNYSNSPHMACLVFDATGQAISACRDDSAYDVSTPAVTGTVMTLKNQIVLNITPSGDTSIEAPATFEVPMVTENSARLTWTGGTGVFNVEYRKTTDTEWTRVLSNSPLFTYVLSGLETGTQYQARVQSVSGSNVSAWKSVAFTTNYVVPFPFLEDFENGMPSHWNRYLGLLESVLAGDATLETIYNSWVVSDKNGVLNGKHAYLNIYGDGTKYWLVTPAIPVESNAHLAFDVAYTLYSGTAQAPQTTGDDDKFVVLVSTDEMATWTILRQWDNAGSVYVLNDLTPSAQYISLDLDAYAGKSVNVAFYGESTIANADNDIHIDNFAVETKPSCERPSAFNASGVTGHTATLTWTGGTGTYNLEYKKAADTEWTRKLSSTTSTTCTLTGLEAETTYQARVQSVGGGGTSGWSTVNFTTTTACPAPTNPVCTACTATSATLDWTENGTATKWEICLNDDEENLIDVTSKPYTLTGLTEETEYTFKVRAVNSDTEKSEWSAASVFQPTAKWVIGSGTATGQHLPTYTYYHYSLTQQIYTAAELGDAANIRSIDFYSTATERTRNLDIYMVATDKASFATITDWVPVAAGDLVFSGEVTFLQNAWTTIELENAFSYDGSSNVVLVVDDNTDSEVSSPSFRVFDAPEQTLRTYGDNENYDPTNPPVDGSNLARLSVKNQIRLVKGEAPTVKKPRSLAVSYTGGTEATVSWVCDEPSFDIDVNGTVTENVANPTTLTGLEFATTYNIKVRAKNETGVSDWTNPVSFNTNISDDMCQIKLVLTDSYGDGWSGNAIRIVDVLTGIVIGTYANEDLNGTHGNGENEVNTIYASVPNDRDIEFQWVSGSYVGETSYAVYDVNGEEIFSGSGGWTVAVPYHVDCKTTPWRTPSDLAASEIGSRSVKLSWTENSLTPATAWVVAYKTEYDFDFYETIATENPFTLEGLSPSMVYTVKVRPATDEVEKWSEEITFFTNVAFPAPIDMAATPGPKSAEITWEAAPDATSFDLQYAEGTIFDITLRYDDDTYLFSIGSSSDDTWTWGVMYPGELVTASQLDKVLIYEHSSENTGDLTINIYQGGEYAPDELLYSETITPEAADAFHEIILASPVTITPAENLWITLTEYGQHVLATCATTERNNQWIYYNGEWTDIGDIASSFADRGWMIRAEINSGIDPASVAWTTITSVTSPYELTGLTPETNYSVRVKANYGSEGESEWAATCFTTIIATPAPTDMAVSTDLDEATITWTGFADSYNLRYKGTEAPNYATITFTADNVWNDGSGYQMLLDADATTYGTIIPTEGGLTTSGDAEASVYEEFEYKIPENADGAMNSENVIIDTSVTIQIPAGTYDWCITNPTPGDRVWIASAAGNVGGRTDDYVFEGGKSYEFHVYYRGGSDAVNVTITEMDIPPFIEWVTVNNVTSPYTIRSLNPKSFYVVEVQGVYDEGESEWIHESFYTPDFDPDGINLAPALSEGEEEGEWYDLSGRKLAGKPTKKGIFIVGNKKVLVK